MPTEATEQGNKELYKRKEKGEERFRGSVRNSQIGPTSVV